VNKASQVFKDLLVPKVKKEIRENEDHKVRKGKLVHKDLRETLVQD
jgi:hypothetical protein